MPTPFERRVATSWLTLKIWRNMALIDPPLTTDKLRDIVQDAHLNFLVGAGASSDLFEPLGDIERILTELGEAEPTTDAIKLARASIYSKFFDAVIDKNHEVLGRSSDEAKAVLDTYEVFATAINRILLRRRSSILHKQVNIFTTNIDIAFEVAFETLALESNDGFAGKFVPKFNTSNFGSLRYRRSLQYENVSEVPTFNLLKMHGSVTWQAPTATVMDGELPDIDFDRTLSGITATKEALEACRPHLIELPEELSTAALLEAAEGKVFDPSISIFMLEYEKLAIVNPTKEKFQTTVLNENYYDLFRIFANELEKENSVLFVLGFSLRDEHIRQLIIRAARANPTLQVMIFCYSSKGAMAVRKLIPGPAVKNGNILIVEPDVSDGSKIGALDLKTITEQYFAPIIPAPKPKPDIRVDVNVTGQADVDVVEP